MRQIMLKSSRARRLKTTSSEVHDGLDRSIMAAEPFADTARYALFVQIQNAFHADIAALYQRADLQALIPDLSERCRYPHTGLDLSDLKASPLTDQPAPRFAPDRPVDVPTALGWLYVAEGSNLGAAFLLKAAAKLGLSETYGARHLAASPEGRANAWRSFTAALDAPELTAQEEVRVDLGAQAAFRRVHGLVKHVFYAEA